LRRGDVYIANVPLILLSLIRARQKDVKKTPAKADAGMKTPKRRQISKGVGRSLTKWIWRAGGTPKTHLVPLFCDHSWLWSQEHFLSGVRVF